MGWLYTLGGLALCSLVVADILPPILSLVLLGLGMILTYGTMTVISSLMLAYVEGPNSAAGVGYYNTVANIGGYFGPVVLGYLSTATGVVWPGFLGGGRAGGGGWHYEFRSAAYGV